MSRRLEKLIEQKAWETLTDYGYNDAHLLEQLTESVLERLANLDEGGHIGAGKQVMNPMSGTPDVLGFSRGGMTKQPKAPTSGIDPDLELGGLAPRPGEIDHPDNPGGLNGIPRALRPGQVITLPDGTIIFRGYTRPGPGFPKGREVTYRWVVSGNPPRGKFVGPII